MARLRGPSWMWAAAIAVALLAGTGADVVRAQTLSLGTVRTEAERAAVRLAIEYTEQIGEIFRVGAGASVPTEGGPLTIVDLSPSVTLETGGEDAFNGVVAKLDGNIIFGSITSVAGVLTPCATCFFHVITLSGGFEADRGFDNTAFLAEAGYVPWFQNHFRGQYPILAASTVALFVQGGYKADTAESSEVDGAMDGAKDESAEAPGSGVLRLRGEYRLNPVTLAPLGSNHVQLVGAAAGWRDLVNSEWYYRVEGGLRLTLTGDQSFDFLYEKGSGAPNFNEGDQFSANLTIAF